MPKREGISRKALAVLHAAAVTASGGSQYVDVQGVDEITFLVTTGDIGADGSNTLALKLQHADATPGSASSYTDVPAEQYQPQTAQVIDDDNQVHALAYVGNKRYVRVAWTEDGTISGSVAVTAVAERLAQGTYPDGVTLTTGAVA